MMLPKTCIVNLHKIVAAFAVKISMKNRESGECILDTGSILRYTFKCKRVLWD